MNRIEKKEIAPDASKIFQEEVRSIAPDITRKELCDMVDDYIYYQTDDMSKEEADAIVEATCILK
jgi:methionine aminopeptidase